MSNFKVVRTRDAGVFAGNVISQEADTVKMESAIRLWQWTGAASLSQLAMQGVTKPDGCKFGVPITVQLFGVIEIIDTTPEAQACIRGIPSWQV